MTNAEFLKLENELWVDIATTIPNALKDFSLAMNTSALVRWKATRDSGEFFDRGVKASSVFECVKQGQAKVNDAVEAFTKRLAIWSEEHGTAEKYQRS